MTNGFITAEDDRRHMGMLRKNYRSVLAETLLELLTEYLIVANQWEEYYAAAANKEFTKECDRAKHAAIQTYEMIPLMEKCKSLGWTYSDLVDIIPGAFETTHSERRAILSDLRGWAYDRYDVIPF